MDPQVNLLTICVEKVIGIESCVAHVITIEKRSIIAFTRSTETRT